MQPFVTIALLLLNSPAWVAGAQEQPLERHVFVEQHFGGMPVELTLYTADEDQARVAAHAAFTLIGEWSAMMSDYAYDPPSPLNRIAARAPEAVAVPGPLLECLLRAREHHGWTHGAFDITAKPLVQLWRVSWRTAELPPADRLERARALVDIQALELDPAAGTARLAKPGMWLDLGGLAKGMIGDRVVRLLSEQGVARCRYRAGGDMVFGDPPPGQSGWHVQVVDFPQAKDDAGTEDKQPRVLEFWASNSAASVSGDRFRHVEIDGRRYAHVIDPRTGLGVSEQRIACVLGPHGMDTDPLATAGLVMDPAEWHRALEQLPGCQGWLHIPAQEKPSDPSLGGDQ